MLTRAVLISCIIGLLVQFGNSSLCALCDSFDGYCVFDGSTCVGAYCATRKATLNQGFVRVQKLCVPSDTPLGCRQAVLWEGLHGEECVCRGEMCNFAARFHLQSTVILVFAWIFVL